MIETNLLVENFPFPLENFSISIGNTDKNYCLLSSAYFYILSYPVDYKHCISIQPAFNLLEGKQHDHFFFLVYPHNPPITFFVVELQYLPVCMYVE